MDPCTPPQIDLVIMLADGRIVSIQIVSFFIDVENATLVKFSKFLPLVFLRGAGRVSGRP